MSHSHLEDESCGCGCGCGDAGLVNPAEMQRWREAPDSEMVCACAGVDKAAVRRAIEQGAFSAPLVKAMTGAGRERGCKERRHCEADVETLVALYAQPPC